MTGHRLNKCRVCDQCNLSRRRPRKNHARPAIPRNGNHLFQVDDGLHYVIIDVGMSNAVIFFINRTAIVVALFTVKIQTLNFGMTSVYGLAETRWLIGRQHSIYMWTNFMT